MYHPISKNLLNPSEIYEKLNNLVQTHDSEGPGVGIGALTADYRDNWAQVILNSISIKFNYFNFISITEPRLFNKPR